MMPMRRRSMRGLAASAFKAARASRLKAEPGDGALVEHGRGDAAWLEGIDHHGGHAHRHQLADVAGLALADAAAAVMDHHRRHRTLARVRRPGDLGRDLDGLALLAALERDRLALLCQKKNARFREDGGAGEQGAGGERERRPSH